MSPIVRAPYLLIPEQLCADLRDTPIALGVYALIARQFLIHHNAIPLSAADLTLFDPSLSYGQARRALERLSNAGWLTCQALGRKNSYVPSWGLIHGCPRPWCHNAERLGRPAHVRTIRIEAADLDHMARLIPQQCHGALVRPGDQPASLITIGQTALCAAGITTPCQHVQTASTPMSTPQHLPSSDQLIDQLIGCDAQSPGEKCASESASETIQHDSTIMPWDSWDHEINKQATYAVICDPQVVASDDCVSIPNHSPDHHENDVIQTHRILNPQRHIFPGEWLELAALQERHGTARMLVWQSRAMRRQLPVTIVTPDYYRACAAADAREALPPHHAPNSAASQELSTARSHMPSPEKLPEAAGAHRHSTRTAAAQHAHHSDGALLTQDPGAMASGHAATPQTDCTPVLTPTSGHAQRLRALGIYAVRGLQHIDEALLQQWEALAQQPCWGALGADPAAVARAMLARGLPPPTPKQLERRMAHEHQGSAPNWSEIIAAHPDYARSGGDIDDLEGRMDVHNDATDAEQEQVEHLRSVFRLHAHTRSGFQAVEQMHIQLEAHAIRLQPARAEQVSILRGLLPQVCLHLPAQRVVIDEIPHLSVQAVLTAAE